MGVITPLFEVLGLCESLDDISFTFPNIHHALGISADKLVQVAMLESVTAVEDDPPSEGCSSTSGVPGRGPR